MFFYEGLKSSLDNTSSTYFLHIPSVFFMQIFLIPKISSFLYKLHYDFLI